MSGKVEGKRIRVTLTRSMHGRLRKHRACVLGLGLRRMHQSVVVKNTKPIRGMIDRIAYLLEIEEL